MAKINFGGVEENVVTREEFPLEKAREVLKNETIAVIGYGVQGPGQSLNLRDNGLNVIVGQREGSKSWEKAVADGWEPGKTLFGIEEAAERATIIQYLLSDAGQIAVWPTIEKHLTPGKALYFSHGFGITYKERTGIVPPADVDVILIAPKGSGTSLRRMFLPGHYWSSKEGKMVRWYDRDWFEYDAVKETGADIPALRAALEAAVKRQLMSDVPYGVLLSGGLDSSIISAVARKFADRRVESHDRDRAWWPRLHSFAIGLEGSPDLAAARKVADRIGTVHHEIHYTIQEGLDALRDVIYFIETYDVTTVRASTPMYLLARVIKSMGIKMVLSGEGADEVFGGYLYFHKAPNARAFHEETVRKVGKLHLYDCLRANKSLSAWGVEGRVPFLDKEFLDVAMRINPEAKMAKDGRIEKWILRKAFEELLPEEIVWRQKEQFSDGVGYGWIDTLKRITSEAVSDREMEHAAERFPINPPRNKEEYYYRTIFEEHFPSQTAAQCVPSVPSVACSTAEALAWDAAFRDRNDPSGRAVLGVHNTDLTHS